MRRKYLLIGFVLLLITIPICRLGIGFLREWLQPPAHNPANTPYVDLGYRQDLNQNLCLISGDKMVSGKLDAHGNFLPDPLKGQWAFKGSFSWISGPPITSIINRWGPDSLVYEYRSGMLVQGRFNNQYRFIPNPGSKVIRLHDFLRRRERVPIYNLPGDLYPEDQVP